MKIYTKVHIFILTKAFFQSSQATKKINLARKCTCFSIFNLRVKYEAGKFSCDFSANKTICTMLDSRAR